MEDLEIEVVEDDQPTDDYFAEFIESVKETNSVNYEQQEKLDKLIDLIAEEKEQAVIQAEEEAKAKAEAEALAEAVQEEQAEADAEMGELEAEYKALEAEYKDSVLSQMTLLQEGSDELLARLDTIIEHQETIILQQLQPSMADNMANVYGYAVVPGIIAIYVLYQMIKPFV